MPGYLNRFIDLDLSEYGEGCYVRLHNPKVVPQSMMEPSTKVVLDEHGRPVDPESATTSGQEMMSRLVKDWHVYDATVLDDDQPLLTLPATPEKIAKLPLGIQALLMKTITDAVPKPD